VSAQGRDFSAFQKPVGPADLKGLSFAYTRVSNWSGTTMGTDPSFAHDWAAIKAAALHRGAYWYLQPAVSPVAQANYFVAAVKRAGLQPGDMLVCDSELLSASVSVDAVTHTFCSEVAALAGPQCPLLVYTNHDVGQHLKSCTGWPLWFAWPSATAPPLSLIAPWKSWAMWQYGIVGGVDADAYNGSPAELDAWVTSHVPAQPASLPEGPDMIILNVDTRTVPKGTPWPGIFLVSGPGQVTHLPDMATVAAWQALGVPEKVRPYADWLLLGGKPVSA
jgi:Glycosyl hydrolases family 25